MYFRRYIWWPMSHISHVTKNTNKNNMFLIISGQRIKIDYETATFKFTYVLQIKNVLKPHSSTRITYWHLLPWHTSALKHCCRNSSKESKREGNILIIIIMISASAAVRRAARLRHSAELVAPCRAQQPLQLRRAGASAARAHPRLSASIHSTMDFLDLK